MSQVLQIYTVFDKSTQAYSSPVVAINDAVVLRMVRSALAHDSMLTQFPEQFSLNHIGSFDESSGRIEAVDHRIVLPTLLVLDPDNAVS